MSGLATVYASTVVRKALNPAFASLVPYVYALVELDEGVRMTTNIVGVDPDLVGVGMRVAVHFENVGEGMCLPLFTPISATSTVTATFTSTSTPPTRR